MSSPSRRNFLKKTAVGASLAAAPSLAQTGAGDTVNVAVVGIHGRGRTHYREYAKMPGVRISYLCDIDERLFPDALDWIEENAGYRPKTHFDFRKLIEESDVDAVSVATPDHWHALHAIWACQAGKDVYVEKPVSYTIQEGRRMVEAARKYDRIVQVGLNRRSNPRTQAAMELLRSGGFGDVYRGKAIIYKGRASIGREKEASIPEGVHWDLYLGPAPYRAYNINRFHYGWHFFWDTSTTDMGNSGVHNLDVVRWGMNKNQHPAKVHCFGGVYVWDSDQQTPNVQNASFEYDDGTIMEAELTNLFTPPMDGIRSIGDFFYTSRGYVSSAKGWHAVRGEFTPSKRSGSAGVDETMASAGFPDRKYFDGPEIAAPEGEAVSHFANFIAIVRSRRREDLHCDILEGHMSTTLCHLANISYRTGRKLTFDPATETFPGDDEANSYLTREYRKPYVLPDEV